MYLHLGADFMVKNSDIIAIFNLNHTQSNIYNEYVKPYGHLYKVIDATNGEVCASMILTDKVIYLSAISSVTLKSRIKKGFV